MKVLKLHTLPVLVALVALSSPLSAAMPVRLANGLSVAVHGPDELLDRYTIRDDDGRLLLSLPGSSPVELIEQTDDPAIANPGDGSFHPMSIDDVLSALVAVDVGGIAVPLDVEIYILPYPRRTAPYSSAAGDRIFLSPGVRTPGRCVTAHTVTHELGHVYQSAFLPDADREGWEGYLSLRGILDDRLFSAFSSHAYRPREVFAEDFRFLFGGADACYTGGIENPDLALPDEVDGLETYVVSLAASVAGAAQPTPAVAAAAYPNPFNPATTIRLELPGDRPRPVEATVHRVDGSLVKRLHAGTATGAVLDIPWDGTDDRGAPVRSGIYFYRIVTPDTRLSGKLVLVR